MKILWLLVLLPATFWSGGQARAQSCTASTAAVVFGNYQPHSGSAVTTTGTVSVTCQTLIVGTVSYSIALSVGGGSSFAARSMGAVSPRLGYQLYKDLAMSQVWGDGSAGTFTVSDSYFLILFPVTKNYTVYGKIPGGENGGVGTYTDSVGVVVTY